MAYGLTEKDSRVYCLESTCHSPDGCRLIPLEEWLKRELNPLFVGSKVLYRSCEVTDDTRVAPKAFWNWVIEARTIPYTKLSTKAGFDLLYNWLFSSERVVQALLEVQTDLSMVRVMKIVGDGPLGHIFAGFCGLVAQFALALYFTIVTITVILFHIPELLHQGRLGRVPAETNERGFVKTTNCSGCTAESLMNLGLLDGTKTDSSWWLPRDFLPRDVASSATGGNLLDLHTTQAKYANTLIDVFVPDYELEQRTRQSVRYSFQKQLARELRQYTGTEEFSYDSDSDSAESD
ncbi:unknown protein [Seminavis robusta]|uniref:Uncharacterized protein n=1 Tax=Seminavis robusta TaxID=568900 RepID=A0A9N8EJI9_9STRA|nr:unknown protein [Seminavis robusta]|eukprot:Sro1182_g249890.1 n/a (292) ;mRNA; f:1474-2349